MQINLFSWRVIDKAQFRTSKTLSFLFCSQILVEKIDKFQLNFNWKIMSSNEVMFPMIFYYWSFDENLNFLKRSLFLTIQNLIHFGCGITFYQSKVVVLYSMACNELNLAFYLRLFNEATPLESFESFDLHLFENFTNLLDFVDWSTFICLKSDELQTVQSLSKLLLI